MAPPNPATSTNIVEWDKINLGNSGDVVVNKKKVTLSEFTAECKRLKSIGGAALVYTGDANYSLSQSQQEAFQVIAGLRVPMKIVRNESDLN